MLVGNTKRVKQIISVGAAELGGILELSDVVVQVVVVLNGLNNVTIAFNLEGLLGHEDVGVMDGDTEVGEVTIILLNVGGVSPGSLVVGNGPGRSAHDTKVMVSVGVQGGEESVLGSEAGLLNYRQGEVCSHGESTTKL